VESGYTGTGGSVGRDGRTPDPGADKKNTSSSRVYHEIRRINREWEDSLARGDYDGVAAHYTEDAIYKGSGEPPTEGRQARAARSTATGPDTLLPGLEDVHTAPAVCNQRLHEYATRPCTTTGRSTPPAPPGSSASPSRPPAEPPTEPPVSDDRPRIADLNLVH